MQKIHTRTKDGGHTQGGSTYLRAVSRQCSATSSNIQMAILLSSEVLSLP